ncbi:hypothetical protein GCM10010123_10770 [Pilimelia anulata]|uniref:Uncharacterized protein n=1 Tax=Pilimelia anulata TaxID=53371 RepID=A0A8J3B835_9ACTN|nr:CotH kinase family protein [Pilimelia anulata]GGJ82979.1 hypothetical protein GCM10010123_10770 [Pilimelia anulata]
MTAAAPARPDRRLAGRLRRYWRPLAACVAIAVLLTIALGALRARPYVTGIAGGAAMPVDIAGTRGLFDAGPHRLAVTFRDGDYERMLDDYFDDGEKGYVEADLTIDGTPVPSVGIRLRGAASLTDLTRAGRPRPERPAGGRPDGRPEPDGRGPDGRGPERWPDRDRWPDRGGGDGPWSDGDEGPWWDREGRGDRHHGRGWRDRDDRPGRGDRDDRGDHGPRDDGAWEDRGSRAGRGSDEGRSDEGGSDGGRSGERRSGEDRADEHGPQAGSVAGERGAPEGRGTGGPGRGADADRRGGDTDRRGGGGPADGGGRGSGERDPDPDRDPDREPDPDRDPDRGRGDGPDRGRDGPWPGPRPDRDRRPDRGDNRPAGAAPTAPAGTPVGPGVAPLATEKPETLPWLIRFDEFVAGRRYQGLREIAVRVGGPAGVTGLNEALALNLLAGAGEPAPRFAYAGFTVNDRPAAARLVVEQPDTGVAQRLTGPGVLYRALADGRPGAPAGDRNGYRHDLAQLTADRGHDLKPVADLLRWVERAPDAAFDRELGRRVDVPALARYVALRNLLLDPGPAADPGRPYYLWYDLRRKLFTPLARDHDLAFADPADRGPYERGGPPTAPRAARPGLTQRFLARPAFRAAYRTAYRDLYRRVYASGRATKAAADLGAVLATVPGVDRAAATRETERLRTLTRQRTRTLATDPLITDKPR